jgi:hypothetical protein
MAVQQAMQHSIESTTLADLLSRISDKGIVIAGDIKVKLVDVELLTVQIRLVICSVEKAKEMGIDWWANNSAFTSGNGQEQLGESLSRIEERLATLEACSSSNELNQGG